MGKKWLGSTPEKCDICNSTFGEFFYDCYVPGRAWGLLCSRCFTAHGCKVGPGTGQMYNTKTKEKVGG